MARYVPKIDPDRPVTIHRPRSASGTMEDPVGLDLDLLQKGNSDRKTTPATINTVASCLKGKPPMPAMGGECCYEGILDESHVEIELYMFLSCILSGAAGHTYGANGTWQVNTREHPLGPSPHGRCRTNIL